MRLCFPDSIASPVTVGSPKDDDLTAGLNAAPIASSSIVSSVFGYATEKDVDYVFERDLLEATETIELASRLAEFIYETHKLDLNQFFRASLAHDETIRCSNFDHLQEPPTASQ